MMIWCNDEGNRAADFNEIPPSICAAIAGDDKLAIFADLRLGQWIKYFRGSFHSQDCHCHCVIRY